MCDWTCHDPALCRTPRGNETQTPISLLPTHQEPGIFTLRRRKNERRETIERLYGAIVAQARLPVFYRSHGVPDTLEARFDMVVLHLYLANRRLAALGEEGKAIGQELLDFFFLDMDASLREIGVGDLSVPKKMKGFAQAYMGRAAAYESALDAKDEAALAAALARNVFGRPVSDAPGAAVMARYAVAAAAKHASSADEAVVYPEIAETLP